MALRSVAATQLFEVALRHRFTHRTTLLRVTL